LENIALCQKGSKGEKDYVALLSVEEDKDVYVVLVSEGYKFYEDRQSSSPYRVKYDESRYSLDELELTEVLATESAKEGLDD